MPQWTLADRMTPQTSAFRWKAWSAALMALGALLLLIAASAVTSPSEPTPSLDGGLSPSAGESRSDSSDPSPVRMHSV